SIIECGGEMHRWEVREYVLAAFQQYLRNQNMFCFWDWQRDSLVPHMSNANYHPKSAAVENSVYPAIGRGNWASCVESLMDTSIWKQTPYDVASNEQLVTATPSLSGDLPGRSQRVSTGDPPLPQSNIACGSATDLNQLRPESYDMVITDPPFGGLLHYSELADFFYVWLRLVLKSRYPDHFAAEHTPKTLEAVSNRARHPDDADEFYQRILTASWRESHRILKPGGLLAFTFHHSEDAPWVSVLKSLFESGFYLVATYPIRSDETKGDGQFGSRKIEYDIIHVCRKRIDASTPISWAKMRRQIIQDVRSLRRILESHSKSGLPGADLQVIRRGKALEYFSGHYGKVFMNDVRPMSVRDALLGIHQILDEEAGKVADPPPPNADPLTRQFLRLFYRTSAVQRDQIHKHLRGTGIAPSDFVARGWCYEDKKTLVLTSHLESARVWHGKKLRGLTGDYDQAVFFTGACFENSGIDVSKSLAILPHKPHPALEPLLAWFAERAATDDIRAAAHRAHTILRALLHDQAYRRRAKPIEADSST
ncbi:MAG: hypothetical protein FWD57_11280, partial [Polyangiaceae bacterium]|nr:hypothetical protein [Polyangiaceae bacterium]